MLFSELRESSVAEETSLLGDGGMFVLLLYGSAGCIIAPDGSMLSWSPLLWEGEMECIFLRRRLREKRETDDVQNLWKYEISILTDDSLSVQVRLSHCNGLFCKFWIANLNSIKPCSLSAIFLMVT